MTMTSSGSEGCRCIDASSILESYSDRRYCERPNGEPGVVLGGVSGSCASLSYGSNACLQHDYEHDSSCRDGPGEVPVYCLQPWCYVNRKTCKRDSTEEIFASDYFPDAELFYSYSTCGSSPDAWESFKESKVGWLPVGMRGLNLTSVIPGSKPRWPLLFKGDKKEINKTWDEIYYDDSIPFEGVFVDFFAELIKVSNGDINSISYTHTSRSSSLKHPDNFTAAVQDVSNGLADMAVGPFWVTTERLKMAPFTIPFLYDKMVLVIPNPTSSNIMVEIKKVLEPFTAGLWMLLVGIIFFVAFLSVCFSRTERISDLHHRGGLRTTNNAKRKRMVWLRLCVDAIIEKGMFFFSGGIEQDRSSGLPNKFLMFGFGFFILVTISAYVANLAAFLTQSSMPSATIRTMEQVSRQNIKICANPVLKDELLLKWPKANWEFGDDASFLTLLNGYEKRGCKVLAIGREATWMDVDFTDRMCDLKLVYTDSIILETPMAFPIKPELVAGVSHWLFKSQMNNGISIPAKQKEYIEKHTSLQPNCTIELSQVGQEESDPYTQITPANMAFPILFVFVFALIAIILQLILVCSKKSRSGRSPFGSTAALLGRVSTLELRKRAKRTIRGRAVLAREIDAARDENYGDEEYENFCCFLGGDAASTTEPNGASKEKRIVNTHVTGESSLSREVDCRAVTIEGSSVE